VASVVPQGEPTAAGGEVTSQRAESDGAFERLYRRYASEVYRYSLALLRDPADAEDVTQTTFMNAYRAMSRGEEPRVPHNWLIKIAHNACKTRYVRRARQARDLPLDDVVEELVVPEEQRTDVKSVLNALGTLPFNQRSALVMRELEGRSYAEIAQTLGVTVPAVETLLFRARRSLRDRTASLRVLGAIQLPSSLSSFFESGGGMLAGGGFAALGTGIAFKAAALLVAGAVAGGVAYSTVQAVDRPSHRTPPAGTPDWHLSGSVAIDPRGSGSLFRATSVTRTSVSPPARAAAGTKPRKPKPGRSTIAGPGIPFPNQPGPAVTPPAAVSVAGVPVVAPPSKPPSTRKPPPTPKPPPKPKQPTSTLPGKPKVPQPPKPPAVTVPKPPPVPPTPTVPAPVPTLPVTVPSPPTVPVTVPTLPSPPPPPPPPKLP
jgi:RNA polymerase sigma factor (sigma-70 family)